MPSLIRKDLILLGYQRKDDVIISYRTQRKRTNVIFIVIAHDI